MIMVLFFILGLLVLFYIGKLVYKEIFKKRVKIEYAQSRLSAGIKRINSVIEDIQKIPQDLADILAIQETRDAELEILLKSILFNNKELYGVAVSYEPYQYCKDSFFHDPYLYRRGDSIIFNQDFDSTDNYFYMDWYLIPKTLMKPNWTEPYFEKSGDHTFMSTFSTPFFRFSGTKEKFSGIVSVDVAIETLTNAVESFGKRMKGDVMLLSENGTVLASLDKDWINNQTIFTLGAEMNLPVLREIGRDLQKGISGLKKIDEFNDHKDVYAFYMVIPINKWGFVLFLSKEVLMNN